MIMAMEDEETNTFRRMRKSSRSICEDWITSLMSALPPRRGETRESLEQKLFLYFDALENEAGGMTRQSLVEAVRRFKYFPAAADLVEFFSERQPEKPKAAGCGENRAGVARVNCLARLAMREWKLPPGLGFWGSKAADAWFLARASDAVTSGAIDGEFQRAPGGGCQHVLTKTISQPQVDAGTLAVWRNEEACAAE